MRHPDEGEIHAWLDGALDPASAAALEAHVAACPACAAAVAEARGLIAGASRILLALDGVPGGVIPASSPTAAGIDRDDLAARRSLQQGASRGTAQRRTPWYARRIVQVAAGLMLVAGVGGVVAREGGRSVDQVSVQFETVPVGVDLDTSVRANAAAASAGGALPSATGQLSEAPAPTAAIGGAAANREQVRADANTAANREQGRADATTADAAAASTAREADASKAAAATAARARDEDLQARQRSSSIVADRPAQAPTAPPVPVTTVPQAAIAQRPSPAQGYLADSLRARSPADTLRLRRMETASVFAPTPGVIAGKVVAADDTPVGQANVTVRERNVAVQTGADGSFTLPPLPPGQYTIEARRLGFAPGALSGVQVASGDTAYARLSLQAQTLQLSEVVVAELTARASPLAGACIALDVDAGSDVAGIPLLPRRLTFRLAQSPVGAEMARGAPSIRLRARVAQAAPRMAGTPSEPSSPLSWTQLTADSIAVTLPTESDVVTLRLEVRGSSVRGTARSNQADPVRSATVSGLRVPCGG